MDDTNLIDIEFDDIVVALIVISVVGGMLIYAHYDIMRIVNE